MHFVMFLLIYAVMWSLYVDHSSSSAMGIMYAMLQAYFSRAYVNNVNLYGMVW